MRFPQQLVPSRNKAGTDSVGLSENMTQPGASTGVRRWQRYKIDMRLRVSVLTKKNATPVFGRCTCNSLADVLFASHQFGRNGQLRGCKQGSAVRVALRIRRPPGPDNDKARPTVIGSNHCCSSLTPELQKGSRQGGCPSSHRLDTTSFS